MWVLRVQLVSMDLEMWCTCINSVVQQAMPERLAIILPRSN